MIKTKTLICFICLLSTAKVFAQGNYGGGIDEKYFNFGFRFLYVSSEFKIQKTDNWRKNNFEDGVQVTDSLIGIKGIQNPGFGLGFVSNLSLSSNVDLRFTPTFVLADRVIDYQFKDKAQYEIKDAMSPDGFTRRTVQSTMFEFPLSIKIKSDRRNNFRAYMIGGMKYGLDISSEKSADKGDALVLKTLKNKKGFLSYEAGIGFDLYLEYFKLSPEIKLSNSIGNVMVRENHPYSNPIDKLFLRNFVFSLYFE